MKRQNKIVREVFAKAFAEGIGGVRRSHLEVLNQLDASDIEHIRRFQALQEERIESLDAAECDIKQTVLLLSQLIFDEPSPEVLKEHGIRFKEIGEDSFSVQYYDTKSDDAANED